MKGLQTHSVHIGDSLQKLARMYQVEDWRTIAEINHLESPYIDSVFGSTAYKDNDRVAKIGSVLVIPSAIRGGEFSDPLLSEEIEVLAYGEDLDIYGLNVVEHRVKGEPREGYGDLNTVPGMQNLAQQLLSRLSVKQGALLLHPNFGSNLHLYVGKNHSQENQNKIIFETERCLRSDFRVQDVKDIKIIFEDNVSYLIATVVPIAPGEPFKLKKLLREV